MPDPGTVSGAQPQLFEMFKDRRKLPRSRSIFFWSWKIGVEQRLRARRAARHVNVDRDHLVYALHDRRNC